MKTNIFQACGHCWIFQICWPIECSTFTASSFKIWNSSTGIPSPPPALFVVMPTWLVRPTWLQTPGFLALGITIGPATPLLGHRCTNNVLQEGGPLPGPQSGLLSNTRKWVVRGGTCADKGRDFTGKGYLVEHRRVREPRRTALPHGSQSWILWWWG